MFSTATTATASKSSNRYDSLLNLQADIHRFIIIYWRQLTELYRSWCRLWKGLILSLSTYTLLQRNFFGSSLMQPTIFLVIGVTSMSLFAAIVSCQYSSRAQLLWTLDWCSRLERILCSCLHVAVGEIGEPCHPTVSRRRPCFAFSPDFRVPAW